MTIYSDSTLNQQVQQPVRGYQSSVGRKLHFGLGDKKEIDSVKIIWPDGKIQLEKPKNWIPTLTIFKKVSGEALLKPKESTSLFQKELLKTSEPIRHIENDFVDFKRERLLPHFLSTQGPRIAVGDVNNDGLDDFYLCGAKGTSGNVWIQQPDGSFEVKIYDWGSFHSESKVLEEDLYRITRWLNQRIEELIRIDPPQWAWFHRRWRHQASTEDEAFSKKMEQKLGGGSN